MASLDPVSGSAAQLTALLRAWDAAEDDPGPLVIVTSGSTGEPKRVRLSRAALRASADATHDVLGGPGQWVLNLPPTYVAGVQVLFRSVRAGTDPVEQAGSLTEAARTMTAERRYVSLVPTQLVRLLDGHGPDLHALTTFDAVLVGGGPLDPAARLRAERAGIAVVQTYGMSETCGGCVYDGHPLPGVGVQIASDGEVELSGPVLFDGYVDADGRLDEARTSAVLRDGWLRTDDLGTIDDDGRLRVTARRDQVVLSGGVNVPGPAVERMLATHPAVADVAVVGRPDPEWGQAVVAVVVPAGEPPTLESLRDLVEPRSWGPRALVLADVLPRTDRGKVDLAAVRRLAAS
jgi:O-succinylbenzoic acid--CoA ligase